MADEYTQDIPLTLEREKEDTFNTRTMAMIWPDHVSVSRSNFFNIPRSFSSVALSLLICLIASTAYISCCR